MPSTAGDQQTDKIKLFIENAGLLRRQKITYSFLREHKLYKQSKKKE